MVSIIIISSGLSAYLKPLIASIISNNHNIDYEIIVVSNNEVRLDFGKLVYNKVFKGYSHACNLGASFAVGDYLLFLNDDMLCGFESIEFLISTFNKTSKCGVVAPKLLNRDLSLQSSFYYSFTSKFSSSKKLFLRKMVNLIVRPFNLRLDLWGLTKINCESRSYGCHAMGSALFTSSVLFKEVKGFDENIFLTFEDQLFCYEFVKRDLKVVFEPRSLFIHFGNKTVKSVNDIEKIYSASLSYFLKVVYE